MDQVHRVNHFRCFQPANLALLTIQKIRRTLERGCTDDWLKNDDFINFLLYLLQCDGNHSLQVEASWIFTNIAAGCSEQTKWIVDRGVIPLTMNLLLSPSDEVVEQALWTLGNIIGESVAYRDITINLDIIPRMLAMNLIRKSVQFRRTFIWVIVNLLRIKDPQISLANAQSMIPTINGLVMNVDSTAKVDALWALTYIADGNEEYIQLVIDSGIISAVVPLLSNHRIKVQLAAMRLLGNIATGTDEQTNVLLNNDILIHIRFPLMHPKDNLRRMALWCMSNITVGSQEQVQAVFHSGLLSRIVESLSREDMKTSREALFTVNNMISLATKEQVLDVINVGAINPLFQLLLSIDEQMARLAQNALKTLFQKADQLVEKYSEIYARLLRSP